MLKATTATDDSTDTDDSPVWSVVSDDGKMWLKKPEKYGGYVLGTLTGISIEFTDVREERDGDRHRLIKAGASEKVFVDTDALPDPVRTAFTIIANE